MLSHANIVSNSFHKTIAVGLRSDEVFLAAPAMFHVAGIAPLLSLMSLGARTVVVEAFEPDVCLDLIEREHCTMMMPVPTMLAAMVPSQIARPRDLSALRLLGHAASPISTELLRRAAATFPGVDLAEFYGATEATAIVTCQHHEELMVESPLVRSCGQPVAGVSVRIIDGSGTEADCGVVGEVIVQSRAVMMGYWQNPEATAQALKDGWFHTGDLGYVDGESNLFLVDRAKDMIVTGGENVYSIEVENALAAAATANRPAPRVIIGMPVMCTDDVEAGRALANEQFALYEKLPAYQAMMASEGAASPADVLEIGNEAHVATQVACAFAGGITDFQATPFGTPEDIARTITCLATIRRSL